MNFPSQVWASHRCRSVHFLNLKATCVLCLHPKFHVVGLIEHQYTRALTSTASLLGGTNLDVWCDQKKTRHAKHPTLNGRETEASASLRWQLNEVIWKTLTGKRKIKSCQCERWGARRFHHGPVWLREKQKATSACSQPPTPSHGTLWT